ncbi:MAG: hypothetical protein KC731_38580, partial [Myxococcales bacterium]|nr:hypothetical protein [Myxococcales bacterium]
MSEVVGLCDACRAGDQEAVERLLRGLPAAAGLVERIGGHRAMVRFLMERRHLVGLMGRPSVESVVEWLHELLREAEPLHLFDPSRALAEAEAGGHAEMVRRLKRHRQFFQPPDPTRWTRRIPSPLEVAFLEACRAGDVALVERSLSEDAELAGTRDVEGRDPLEVVAAQGGEETLAVAKRLLAAGLPRHAGPVARAAARGDEPLLALLLGAGWPTVDGRERHALMEAAVAEGAGRLDT